MASNKQSDGNPRILLMLGILACPLFIATVLIHDAKRPDYNSLLYPLSSLSIGRSGWVQISNFIVTGTLLILFSIGLNKVLNSGGAGIRAPLLIGLAGIGLIGAGICVTDPVFGYPTDKPLALRQSTLHGHLHDIFSMLVFICLPWACFVFRKYFHMKAQLRWARYSALTAYAMIAMFILASAGFQQVRGLVQFAGLLQRLCAFAGLLWITLLALHLLENYSTAQSIKNARAINR